MLRLPTNPLGPFWLEDLGYFFADAIRRLPARARAARDWIVIRTARSSGRIDDLVAFLSRKVEARRRSIASPRAASAPARLDEHEEWALATEPLAAADMGTARAAALHQAAAEQLDALTYVLDRLRDEVRPLMTYARFADEPVHMLPEANRNEAALEALLNLARENALTRPNKRSRKHRAASAA